MLTRKIKLWGLVSHQPRWGLTFRGWLVILLAIALTLWLAVSFSLILINSYYNEAF